MKKTAIALAAVAAFIALLVYLTMGNKRVRVEVCVAYQGRTACRTASGESRESAQRTATDNACAQIASGMTDSMACTSRPPVSLRWLD